MTNAELIAWNILGQMAGSPAGGTAESHHNSRPPQDGYFVGGAVSGLVYDSFEDAFADRDEVVHFIRSLPRHVLVGWWTDPEDGKFYLDGTTWTAFRETAETHAHSRGELAYYDAANEKDVRVA